MSAGSSIGKSPCTLTTIRRAAAGRRRQRLEIRSEPEAWSPRVITARPPAAVTAAAISVESVATATGPTAASCARRITRTIIGTPPMSASGLPGRRVEAMRAGIRIRTSEFMDNRRLGAAPDVTQ